MKKLKGDSHTLSKMLECASDQCCLLVLVAAADELLSPLCDDVDLARRDDKHHEVSNQHCRQGHVEEQKLRPREFPPPGRGKRV